MTMPQGLVAELTRLAWCDRAIVGIDRWGHAIRWDRGSGDGWESTDLRQPAPPPHCGHAATPHWIGGLFLMFGGHVVRLIGLDGVCRFEFVASGPIRAAAWNGTELFCVVQDGGVLCLDKSLQLVASWDPSLSPIGIEFVGSDLVLVWGLRQFGTYTRSGAVVRSVADVPGLILGVACGETCVVLSSVDDESFVADLKSNEPPTQIAGFVAGVTPGAVWTVAGGSDKSTVFTRWRERDGRLVSPSSVSVAWDEWRSQRATMFEWRPGLYVIPMQGGILAVSEREDGQLQIARTIRTEKVVGRALRAPPDACLLLYEDATLETVELAL
jgi:hypothetical protein